MKRRISMALVRLSIASVLFVAFSTFSSAMMVAPQCTFADYTLSDGSVWTCGACWNWNGSGWEAACCPAWWH
jgi:hypothetical protein